MLDNHLHAQRHLIECGFSKLKQFRRTAPGSKGPAWSRTHSDVQRPYHLRAIIVLAALDLSVFSAARILLSPLRSLRTVFCCASSHDLEAPCLTVETRQ
jgi:hypothetical protein